MNIAIKITGVVLLLGVIGFGVNGAAQKISYENPSFCSNMCHLMDPYYESYTSEEDGRLAQAHAEADVLCKDCHHTTLPQQLEEVYINVTGQAENPLKERRVKKDECIACHEHDTYEQIRALTADVEPTNPHDSHWGEMECRLRHKMHRPSVDYCVECHEHDFDVP